MNIEADFNKFKKLYDKKEIRKLSDMGEHFENSKIKIKKNPLIYTVYRKSFGEFETGVTVIEAGSVNKEFFMTKGHKHKKSRQEIYILLKGRGKLLVQDKKVKIINLEKNKVYIIKGTAGHRLINTGNKRLEVLTIYSKEAGRGYHVNFKKRFFE